MSNEPRFKLIWQKMTETYESLHVAVDYYHRWPDKNPDSRNEIILTYDTDSPEETIQSIDDLIGELQGLKKRVRKKWSAKRRKK